MDSFIQYPPRLFERPVNPSDVHLHSHPYTPSSDFTSQTIPDEDLDGPIRGSSLMGSNSPQDSGLGVSISSVSKGEPQKMRLGITPVTGFFDNAHPRESLLSTYSTESFSPSQDIFQPESGEPPRTSTPSAVPLGSNARQAPASSALMQARPLHRRAKSIADSEMMSLRSPNTRHASRPLTNPPIRDRGLPPSREFNSFPGLPSSPVATLPLSRSASEQDLMPNRIPPLLGNSYTFLDSPPRRKPPLGTRSIGHSRSLSESFAPSRPVGPGISQTETLDSKPSPSPNYASVAYAREKALQSARPRAKSVLPPVRTPASSSTQGPINHSRPNVKDHGAVIGTLNRQSQNELVLLSSRRRSRPRSRPWSIGKDAPERI
ncbi:hypothetical protein JB92DRAFT_3132726 [Gautieria morchelliformis]|nr:hypothetical protein JB92DRAFT_3132726 [Gautieria morchelliformis]